MTGPATSADHRRSQSAVVEHLRADDRFVVVTHENPDGDALGSLVAMHALLDATTPGPKPRLRRAAGKGRE